MGIQPADNIRIAAAAQEAVKHIPNYVLGNDVINNIISQVSHGHASIAERVISASNLATAAANAFVEQQKNRNPSDAGPRSAAANNAFAYGGGLGLQNSRFAMLDGGAARTGTSSSGSSSAYSNIASTSVTNSNFLNSVGLNSFTGSELGKLGFNQADVRRLLSDSNSLGFDKNGGTLSLGRLKESNPDNYSSHLQYFRGYQADLTSVEAMQKRLDDEKDPGKRAQLQQAIAKKREEIEKKHEAQQKKIKTEKERKNFNDTRSRVRASEDLERKAGLEAVRNSGREDTREVTSAPELAAQDERTRKDTVISEQRTEQTRLSKASTFDDDAPEPATGPKKADAPLPEQPTQSAAAKKEPGAVAQQIAAAPSKEAAPTKPVVEAKSSKGPAGPTMA
jgi:hypothetical protein